MSNLHKAEKRLGDLMTSVKTGDCRLDDSELVEFADKLEEEADALRMLGE